jgi:hypothetical protein
MREEIPPLPLPAHICPLCGGPNGCAPAACGRFEVECWCSRTRIAADVLARIPAEQRLRACVCARCAGAEAGPGRPSGVQ